MAKRASEQLSYRAGRRSTKRVQFDLPLLPGAENQAVAAETLETARQSRSVRQIIQLQRKLTESANDFLALWAPITMSQVLVCVMTLIRNYHVVDPDVRRAVLTPEVELSASAPISGLQNWQVLLIVLAIAMLMIVVVTSMTLLLLNCDCFLFLRIYICISFGTMALYMLVFWLHTAGNALLVAVDFITVGIVSYNTMVIVLLAVGASSHAPKRLIQIVHILLSAAISYIIVNMVIGQRFIYASMLCLMFSAWDLFAVLCPRGPLNSIIKLAERKQGVTGFLQPLVYSAIAWTTMTTSEEEDEVNDEITTRSSAKQQPKRGSRLGLGDFIFYGALTASAALESGIQGALACYLGLFIGFCATILGLKLLDRALPALPLPILAAVITVALNNTVGQSFSNVLVIQQVFL